MHIVENADLLTFLIRQSVEHQLGGAGIGRDAITVLMILFFNTYEGHFEISYCNQSVEHQLGGAGIGRDAITVLMILFFNTYEGHFEISYCNQSVEHQLGGAGIGRDAITVLMILFFNTYEGHFEISYCEDNYKTNTQALCTLIGTVNHHPGAIISTYQSAQAPYCPPISQPLEQGFN